MKQGESVLQNSQILMLTSSYDRTCDYLINKFKNLSFFRLNLDQFSRYKISYSKNGFKISDIDSHIETDNCQSIYFRKPSMENLTGVFEAKYHNFIHKESFSLIEGIAESFEGTVLTKPSIMRRANNKVVQVTLAKSAGLEIPELSITNDGSLLKYYSDLNGIIKPLSIGEVISEGKKEFVQTNLINSDIHSTNFEYSPVYLQQYISKDYEVRITVVGDEFFPVRIDSSNQIDWRKPNNEVVYSAYTVPNEIKKCCIKYMQLCNMNFGCFDFIVKGGEWYFLEMNANGQWAWLEISTELKISDKIIELLNT